jgi:hypothetical protein
MADDPAPAPAPQPAPAPKAPPEPEVFSREYVTELRRENQGWRLKAQEMEGKSTEAQKAAQAAREAAEAATTKANEEATQRATQAEQRANERVIRAELRTAAVKAGMIDLDGLKLADLSAVKINADGEVEGADALMEGLKTAKPYLFGQPGTAPKHTSNPNPPPNPTPTAKKRAVEMTDEEFDAAMKRIDAGKGVPA